MKLNQKTTAIFIIIMSVILAILFGYVSFQAELKRPRLPVLGQIHSFSLLDADAKEFKSKQLNGRVWVADFFFTTCGDICPMMTKHMAALNRSFELVPNVALVSLSVNPENDSPEILKIYAKKQNAGKNWYFLTGSRAEITKIAVESFKLAAAAERQSVCAPNSMIILGYSFMVATTLSNSIAASGLILDLPMSK